MEGKLKFIRRENVVCMWELQNLKHSVSSAECKSI
jgi:hypothetical protein